MDLAGESEECAPGQRVASEQRLACRLSEALVAAAFAVPLSEIRRRSRGSARAALARQTAMYLAHVESGLALNLVARHFGRDRTTVAHACAQVEDRREDATFDRLVHALKAALNHGRDGAVETRSRR